MSVHLITGYAGYEHIKAEDDAQLNCAIIGDKEYVFEVGSMLDAIIKDNNTIRIYDGDILMQGRHIRINTNTYEDITIENGTAGFNRIDLIVMTYEKNPNDGTENAFIEVIKGANSANTPNKPSYTTGKINQGAIKNQMPLFYVHINGVVTSRVEVAFSYINTFAVMAERYKNEFESACNTYLGSLNILDSLEEIKANTSSKQLAGALALKEAANEMQAKIKTYTDVVVKTGAWESDTTYDDYPFRAKISFSMNLTNYVPYISFSLTDNMEGIYAPIAKSVYEGVYIWASEKPATDITIPTIQCIRKE